MKKEKLFGVERKIVIQTDFYRVYIFKNLIINKFNMKMTALHLENKLVKLI